MAPLLIHASERTHTLEATANPFKFCTLVNSFFPSHSGEKKKITGGNGSRLVPWISAHSLWRREPTGAGYLYGHFCDWPKSYAQYSTQIGDIFWELQLLVVPTFLFQQIIPSSLPSSSIGINWVCGCTARCLYQFPERTAPPLPASPSIPSTSSSHPTGHPLLMMLQHLVPPRVPEGLVHHWGAESSAESGEVGAALLLQGCWDTFLSLQPERTLGTRDVTAVAAGASAQGESFLSSLLWEAKG